MAKSFHCRGRRRRVGAGGEVDLAAPRADREAAVGQQRMLPASITPSAGIGTSTMR